MARRRSRGTWFPNIGSQIGALPDATAGRQFALLLPVNSTEIITGIFPLTMDVPQEGDNLTTATDTLSDIIGGEYVLQRIVGKCYIERQFVTNAATGRDNNPAVLVAAGFFVARANDESVGGGEDTPIGSATEAERRDNYSPLEVDTVREPWIWRRTWILGNAGSGQQLNVETGGVSFAIPATIPSVAAYPRSTALYGSVADGAHIDSRVKRRVSQDNRLFFAVSAKSFPITVETANAEILSIVGYLDFRIFGSLRKARNSSAF